MSVTAVVQTGGQSFVAIVLSVLTTLAIVAALAHRFGIPRNLAVLIAAGTAVSGATAIMALAPLMRARATGVSFAIAVITLFGTAAIAVYPLIGHALAMSEHAFGTWTGMAIHETAQVIAAAFQYGDVTGETGDDRETHAHDAPRAAGDRTRGRRRPRRARSHRRRRDVHRANAPYGARSPGSSSAS